MRDAENSQASGTAEGIEGKMGSYVPYRLVYMTQFFAPRLNIKRMGASWVRLIHEYEFIVFLITFVQENVTKSWGASWT